MNILSDLHHSGLYYSFHLLFEKRLGFKLFRPVGTDWFTEGFWDIAKPYDNNLDTVRQYLSLDPDFKPIDGSPELNTIIGKNYKYFTVQDKFHDFEQKAITLQQFKDMDIDIIIASIPDHWVTYETLRRKYHPNAKLICHTGNIGWDQQEGIKNGTVKNLMASTKAFNVPNTTNAVFYYQEQPLGHYVTPRKYGLKIKSFVHLLPLGNTYHAYKQELSDVYNFSAFGAGAPDGWAKTLDELYTEMNDSNYVFHLKPGGDGYGWNWHTAFMLGRPILTNFSDYRDKLGGVLFEDMVTGLDLEKRTFAENCKILREGMDELGERWGKEARRRFEKTVNYELEGQKITQFLNDLK
jgi:hypothetical protein